MVVVSVCVGSSCHMKGSYQVIKTFQELIKKNQLEDVIELKASFCMGRCLSGISVMVNDTPVQNVGFVNAENVFYEHVFPLAQAEKAGE
ncbi:MAG: (2Fe-2S) ferredoxin domain-containing protein [Candidatus Pararuminococcus gallinarum]|jgi:NADH:ubiquinone oxidoreductase subunit E|uniref:NAD(P)H-dependent oxidoreductase subunit E n=1 Tax=Zongyangia sp. HA2173 TaxID=3133035 RepID=UPI00174A52C4